MAIYFTSDNHFGHLNIIKYCLRGYGTRAQRVAEREQYSGYDELEQKSKLLFKNADDMSRVLTERWNSVVAPGDTVYHLGDFAMGNRKDWQSHFDGLNGAIHLIYGNHDCHSDWTPYKEIYEMGFASINEQLFVEVDGHKLWMAHIPLSHAPDKRGYVRPKPTEKYDIALAGHVHDKYFWNDTGCINVGCDNTEFYPVTLEQLLQKTAEFPQFDSSTFLPV